MVLITCTQKHFHLTSSRHEHDIGLTGTRDLVFGHDAAGERDRAAFTARVVLAAVEVHVLRPVGVGRPATAPKLRRRKKSYKNGFTAAATI